MPQNKLKAKVEGLTKIVKQLLKELQITTDLAQGTLTAFQLHLGEEDWNKLIEELKNKEQRQVNTTDKKLEV
jgi:hypothetical protein